MRRLFPAALLVVLLGPNGLFATSLEVDGRFLRDESGRAVFFHGVNAVWKRAPEYYPPSSAYGTGAVPPSESFFDGRDAAFLAANGLTTVRLGVMWAGVEPERDEVDEAYLDRIEDLVDMLGEKGILVLLDFHQDMYNEIYEGQGFPAWATPSAPLPPNLPFFGFPGGYFLNPATMHAFDRMWLDADGLWAEYRAFWKHVADRFKDKPNLLGYDLMNEPWPGTQWPSCVNTQGCPLFDVGFLQPFFENAIAGIREVDTEHVVWWEPQVIADGGAANNVGLLAPIADSAGKTGVSFHVYCASTLFGSTTPPEVTASDPLCPLNADLAFRQQEDASVRNDSALFLTEFGATDSVPYVGLIASLADAHMVSWHYWQYAAWQDPTGNPAEEGMFRDDLARFEPGQLKEDKADVLIRTYPRAVAGAPKSFSFDPATGEFSLTYVADPSIPGPTEIFVPVVRHYPNGYAATVTGPGTIASAENATLLTVDGSGAGEVTVTVGRR